MSFNFHFRDLEQLVGKEICEPFELGHEQSLPTLSTSSWTSYLGTNLVDIEHTRLLGRAGCSSNGKLADGAPHVRSCGIWLGEGGEAPRTERRAGCHWM
jgi:hypothetical protein